MKQTTDRGERKEWHRKKRERGGKEESTEDIFFGSRDSPVHDRENRRERCKKRACSVGRRREGE